MDFFGYFGFPSQYHNMTAMRERQYCGAVYLGNIRLFRTCSFYKDLHYYPKYVQDYTPIRQNQDRCYAPAGEFATSWLRKIHTPLRQIGHSVQEQKETKAECLVPLQIHIVYKKQTIIHILVKQRNPYVILLNNIKKNTTVRILRNINQIIHKIKLMRKHE